MKIRYAQPEDFSLYFKIRNEPQVKAHSTGRTPVTKKWFSENRREFLILEIKGKACGYLRIQPNEMLSVGILKSHREKGFAKKLLELYQDRVLGSKIAVIHKDNEISESLFKRLGFEMVPDAFGMWVKK